MISRFHTISHDFLDNFMCLSRRLILIFKEFRRIPVDFKAISWSDFRSGCTSPLAHTEQCGDRSCGPKRAKEKKNWAKFIRISRRSKDTDHTTQGLLMILVMRGFVRLFEDYVLFRGSKGVRVLLIRCWVVAQFDSGTRQLNFGLNLNKFQSFSSACFQ